MTPPRVVLTGVAGSGKSTIGRALATALTVPFVDADDFHPAANRARMARGEALDDEARAPWLAAIHAHLRTQVAAGAGFVLACSALKERYRQDLATGLPPLRWVQLVVDEPALRQRLRQRRDHFFPEHLLASQLQSWEPLANGIIVDASAPIAELVQTLRDHVRA